MLEAVVAALQVGVLEVVLQVGRRPALAGRELEDRRELAGEHFVVRDERRDVGMHGRRALGETQVGPSSGRVGVHASNAGLTNATPASSAAARPWRRHLEAQAGSSGRDS
jgi:hypothetical protein